MSEQVLPGGFSAVVQWDDGRTGTYFQSVLYSGVRSIHETNHDA